MLAPSSIELIFPPKRLFILPLTSTVAPFLVSIVIACHGAPWPIVVLFCAPVITAAFVDERESTAVTRRCPLSASPCLQQK